MTTTIQNEHDGLKPKRTKKSKSQKKPAPPPASIWKELTVNEYLALSKAFFSRDLTDEEHEAMRYFEIDAAYEHLLGDAVRTIVAGDANLSPTIAQLEDVYTVWREASQERYPELAAAKEHYQRVHVPRFRTERECERFLEDTLDNSEIYHHASLVIIYAH